MSIKRFSPTGLIPGILVALLTAAFFAAPTTLGAPADGGSARDGPPLAYTELREVTVRGTLIDLAEVFARDYAAHVEGASTERPFGLRRADGGIYTFLDNARYRELIERGTRKGQNVEVSARQFPRSLVLEVLSFKVLPPETAARVYFCRTCVIYAYKPGPCVCCGMEVELLPDTAAKQ